MMAEKELSDRIKDQHIFLPMNGIDNWPGFLMTLDSDQITVGDKIIDIKLMAWYELDKDNSQPRSPNAFIIKVKPCEYIIVDFFFEAVEVWNYYLKTYPN